MRAIIGLIIAVIGVYIGIALFPNLIPTPETTDSIVPMLGTIPNASTVTPDTNGKVGVVGIVGVILVVVTAAIVLMILNSTLESSEKQESKPIIPDNIKVYIKAHRQTITWVTVISMILLIFRIIIAII